MKLQLHAATGGWRLVDGGRRWERTYDWITWAEYDTRLEAAAVGLDLCAGSPRDCLGWRIVGDP